MGMIQSDNLVYEYIRRNEEGEVEGIKRAVDGVELSIKKGDFVAILGHNGSGKSTLAKMLNAILYPSEGALWVDGMDTSKEENLWEIRQTAGMVFQNPDNQLVANVVEEDVAFGPENLGVESSQILKRVETSLKKVGMWKFRHRSPNHLSGGQKQRVAIAGIMAMKPKCIILDEPTAMLDPNGRKEVIDTIKELNRKENITVLLITHYMEEVVDADQVIVMDQGKVVMEGTPKEIFSQVPKLQKLRLTVPQVTQLAYELKLAGMPLPDGILTRREFVEAVERICHVNHT
ncbi:MAG: energy-coupling factor transporter ATPase [Clostridiales bacterium]|nr:energy-coupling factor transporter ATPase [Clostridiales bacterium]